MKVFDLLHRKGWEKAGGFARGIRSSGVVELLAHCYPRESLPAFSLQLQAREKLTCNATLYTRS